MPRPPDVAGGTEQRGTDLRALVLGAAAWGGGLTALAAPGWTCLLLGGFAAGWLLHRARRGHRVATLVAALLAAAAVAASATARVQLNRSSAVASLAEQSAAVRVTATVTGDPVQRTGRFGRYMLTRVRVREVDARGRLFRTDVPVLVIGDVSWSGVALGATVQAIGKLAPAQGPDLAGVLTSRSPTVLSRPATAFSAAAAVRAGIRAAVVDAAPGPRTLVPALVVGDDQQMPEDLVQDFRACGLTHLAAVSGTNLTLVVGFLLVLARWAGVRARGMAAVGALGVAGFVLLARPEPSVLRAAAMGSVALLGMGSRGSDQGVRALGVAVFALLLLDPWLAVSIGFALSALATAGILLLGPSLRDALRGWLPRWAAEALAVPFAAQLACTPMVAAISGQVSLVAVLANLLVAPVVGPATVLGLLGGVVVLAVPAAGRLLGTLAGACAGWIITVATHLARLPTAAVEWPVAPVGIAVLGLLCLLLGLTATRVLRRARWSAALSLVLVVVVLRPLPTPGWPPRGWVVVACDVGQGDGLVLNAGGSRGVLVDAGPDPRAMDRCLTRLGIGALPVVVLTHFHADHVDGLPAVLADHRVGEVDVTATEEPPGGAQEVRGWTAVAHVPERVPRLGEVRRVGDLTWQVIGPVAASSDAGHGEEGSVANNSSLVLLVETHGIRILMGGDMEPEAQQALARALPGLRVDVLKVPHHGSRYQDPELLGSLGARLALISVGADNDYGHPADSTLAVLRRAGMRIERTDRDGDVAVTVEHGRIGVRTR